MYHDFANCIDSIIVGGLTICSTRGAILSHLRTAARCRMKDCRAETVTPVRIDSHKPCSMIEIRNASIERGSLH